MSKVEPTRALLLQSGGIDSAAAAIHLLEAGYEVVALTLAKNASSQTSLPKMRATEIAEKHPLYSWAMIDITDWDQLIERHINTQVAERIPVSCLTCILSKLTASAHYCNNNNIRFLALGYTTYQSSWAEQTSNAIQQQRNELKRLGISLLLPSSDYTCKESVIDTLKLKELTPRSLENPCCIGTIGTQDTPSHTIDRVISTAFLFFQTHQPNLKVVDTIGPFPS